MQIELRKLRKIMGLLMSLLLIGLLTFGRGEAHGALPTEAKANSLLNIPAAGSPWAKAYGTANSGEGAAAIAPAHDGGYIIAGSASIPDGVEGRIWKIDELGAIAWQQAYHGSNQEPFGSIAATSDGGYVAAGNTNFGAGSTDAWVVKLDANGALLWQKAFGGVDSDGAISVLPTSDGGLLVTGFTEILALGRSDNWILKLDAAGNIVWQKRYGLRGSIPGLRSIAPTSDGGFIIGGVRETSTGNDAWVLKLDGDGNILWEKPYGSSAFDWFTAILPLPQGGYLAAGSTESSGAVNVDAWLVELDALGNLVWQKTFGGDAFDQAVGLALAPNGNVLVAGDSRSFGAGGFDAWLIQVDDQGNLLWQKAFGGSNDERLVSLIPATNGGYLLVGTTESFGPGGIDAWVLRVDSNGDLPPACSLEQAVSGRVLGSTASATSIASSVVSEALSANASNATSAATSMQMSELCETIQEPLQVNVDIKPGDANNTINLKSKGVIPLAILSTATFDARTVDWTSVCFGDADDASQRDCSEAHGKAHWQDVDGDGVLDLVLHFETYQTGIDEGDTRACLTGITSAGSLIEGCDAIRIKP